MSHRVQKRARRAARAAMMTASLPVIFIGAPALAQQTAAAASATSPKAASPDDLTEVVVTGYRESLQSALDRKRDSVQPIESVVAEDIGKMPDQNVSESLQRLPGVSINRSGGKGTQCADRRAGQQSHDAEWRGVAHRTGNLRLGESSGGGAGSQRNTPRWKASRAKKSAASTSSRIPRRDHEGGLGRHHRSEDPLLLSVAGYGAELRQPSGTQGAECRRRTDAGRHSGRRLQIQRRLRNHGQRFVRRRKTPTTSSSRTRTAISGSSPIPRRWVLRRKPGRQHQHHPARRAVPTSIRSWPTSATSLTRSKPRARLWARNGNGTRTSRAPSTGSSSTKRR